jgi:hypothetical protein
MASLMKGRKKKVFCFLEWHETKQRKDLLSQSDPYDYLPLDSVLNADDERLSRYLILSETFYAQKAGELKVKQKSYQLRLLFMAICYIQQYLHIIMKLENSHYLIALCYKAELKFRRF